MKSLVCFLFICSCFFTQSCKKYLDQPPTTDVGYLTTIANCQALLDNSDVMNGSKIGRTPVNSEESNDDYFLTLSQFNSLTPIPRATYVWDMPFNLSSLNEWILSYQPVYHANACLEAIDRIDKSSDVLGWNNVKGSAYFFRAYYFLQLIWQYGKGFDVTTSDNDLGISLKLSTDLYEPTIRSNVSQTYYQIITDAMESAEYLPDTPSHPFRPSRAAAYGLLARTYLTMRMYDSAGKYAEKCLALKNQLIDYNSDGDIVNPFGMSISPFRIFNKETIFYSAMLRGAVGMQSSFVDTILYSSYSVDDLRKQAFFATSGGYQVFKGTYTQDATLQFSGIATDEMYLIQAECYARGGDKDNALTYLNTLLLKRYAAGTFVPVTAASPQQALQMILLERRKELLLRGLRWSDLKRLNKEPSFAITLTRLVNGQSYVLPPNDNRYALPIPETVLAVSGMLQNPR